MSVDKNSIKLGIVLTLILFIFPALIEYFEIYDTTLQKYSKLCSHLYLHVFAILEFGHNTSILPIQYLFKKASIIIGLILAVIQWTVIVSLIERILRKRPKEKKLIFGVLRIIKRPIIVLLILSVVAGIYLHSWDLKFSIHCEEDEDCVQGSRKERCCEFQECVNKRWRDKYLNEKCHSPMCPSWCLPCPTCKCINNICTKTGETTRDCCG